MNFIFSLVKTAALTAIVLLLSQVQVKGKRICDHVGDITQSSAVQKPIQVLSANLDFTDGKSSAVKKQNQPQAKTKQTQEE